MFTSDRSHKKQNDSLETQAVLLIFLLEHKQSEVVVQRIHQNSKKMVTFVRNYFVKKALRLF